MPESDEAEMQGKSLQFLFAARRFATCGRLFAAAGRASLARGAQIPRMRKIAGFFRVGFAGEVSYASFVAWKSSFAK
jgi:hypothetical protein